MDWITLHRPTLPPPILNLRSATNEIIHVQFHTERTARIRYRPLDFWEWIGLLKTSISQILLEAVLVNYYRSKQSWIPGTIIRRLGSVNYYAEWQGDKWKRHANKLRKRYHTPDKRHQHLPLFADFELNLPAMRKQHQGPAGSIDANRQSNESSRHSSLSEFLPVIFNIEGGDIGAVTRINMTDALINLGALYYDGVMSCAPKANASNPIDDEVLREARAADKILITAVTTQAYNPQNAKTALKFIQQKFTQLSQHIGVDLKKVGHKDRVVNIGGKLAIRATIQDKPQRCQKGIEFFEKAKPAITEIAYIVVRCPDGTTKQI
ncbi:unnamed protein product [Caenorhabditis bovis]|uniref:Uncharacterized protein n=1 Tax=Caenorhabditis bovis TaxID=2654633 RepID=A0A8S1F5U1_9PELO|nr:unnamed protein product [Caenorhabditis bovis]